MYVLVQMDLQGPDARQVGIKQRTTLINYLTYYTTLTNFFSAFFERAPSPQLVAT